MANPNCKILIYDTDDNLVHTVTGDVLEANVNPACTSQIGTFSFMLPGKKGHSYVYDDVGNNYMVKIYLGYGTLGAGDLQMIGKVIRIDSTKDMRAGCYRVVSGKDLGEILERHLKTNRRYEDLACSTIVAVDIAADAEMDAEMTSHDFTFYNAAKIPADANEETVTIRTESFFDYLRKVSDYWIDAGTKIQKEWLVDTEGQLVWKNRPLRTVGVETLTTAGVNANILAYRVIYDIAAVKNRISVFGAPSSYFPNDKDLFTDALSGTLNGVAWGWTADSGTLSLEDFVGPKEGTYYIQCIKNAGNYVCDMTLTLPRIINLRDINKLNFWYTTTGLTPKIRLYAPNSTSYFQADLTQAGVWTWFDQALGDANIYDADENPSGAWTAVGAPSPNWWNITKIRIFNAVDTSTRVIYLDKLYFSPDRWFGIAPDAGDEPTTSQSVYGLRVAEFTDENLLSNTECTSRAFALLTQLEDRVLGAEVSLKGNTNVKVGDRLPLTITGDNISAVSFDVASVSHVYKQKPLGLRTNASLIYAGNTRVFPPRTPVEGVQRNLEYLKRVTSEIYSRVVR